MTLPLGTDVHCSTGRLRVRIRDKLGDAAFFEKVSKAVASRFPEAEVSVNPSTGSVLCKGIDHQETLARVARSEGLFELRASEKRPPLAQTVQESFTQASLAIRRSTHGELDLSTNFSETMLLSAPILLPGLRSVLNLKPLRLSDLGVVLGGTLASLGINEAFKAGKTTGNDGRKPVLEKSRTNNVPPLPGAERTDAFTLRYGQRERHYADLPG